MKSFVIAFLIGLIFVLQAIAQNPKLNEFQKLEQQISVNSTLKDIDKILSEAKKIAQNSEKNAGGNWDVIADSLMGLTAFRKKIFLIIDEKRSGTGLSNEEKAEAFLKYHSNAKEIRDLLERVIKIYETNIKKESVPLATAKYELAYLADIYIPQAYGPVDWKEKLERINYSQNLYSQALYLQSKLLEANDDAVLLTIYLLANSYVRSADFEKALPLYERYISVVETKYGKKSADLTSALEMRTAILQMIGQEENSPKSLLFLSPRAKSFKYEGINAKAGRVVLETAYKNPESSNSMPKFPVSSASVQGGAIFPETIPIIVTVDENGKIIEAQAQIENGKLKDKIEKNVREWELKPFIYEGQAKKIKGIVYYYN